MQQTTNYNLNKPEAADQYNIEHFNGNADIIDTQMKENEDNITALDNASLKKANNLSDLNDKSAAMTNIIDSYTAATNVNVNNDNIEVMTRKVETGNVITWYKTKFLSIWNYIAGKISSVLGLTSTNYSGTAATAGTADALTTARTIDGVSFNGGSNITHYGTCSVAAATAAKTVTITGFTLAVGARVTIRFTYANTATTPTLNVNSTGAKQIRLQNNVALTATTAATLWKAYQMVQLVYDGTYWLIDRPIDISGDAATANIATKLGSTTLGSATEPIYLNSGSPTQCNNYAGGTAVTLNGTSKAASAASFYAPLNKGTLGQILRANTNGIPEWFTQNSNRVSFSLVNRSRQVWYTNDSDIIGSKCNGLYLIQRMSYTPNYIYGIFYMYYSTNVTFMWLLNNGSLFFRAEVTVSASEVTVKFVDASTGSSSSYLPAITEEIRLVRISS